MEKNIFYPYLPTFIECDPDEPFYFLDKDGLLNNKLLKRWSDDDNFIKFSKINNSKCYSIVSEMWKPDNFCGHYVIGFVLDDIGFPEFNISECEQMIRKTTGSYKRWKKVILESVLAPRDGLEQTT